MFLVLPSSCDTSVRIKVTSLSKKNGWSETIEECLRRSCLRKPPRMWKASSANPPFRAQFGPHPAFYQIPRGSEYHDGTQNTAPRDSVRSHCWGLRQYDESGWAYGTHGKHNTCDPIGTTPLPRVPLESHFLFANHSRTRLALCVRHHSKVTK